MNGYSQKKFLNKITQVFGLGLILPGIILAAQVQAYTGHDRSLTGNQFFDFYFGIFGTETGIVIMMVGFFAVIFFLRSDMLHKFLNTKVFYRSEYAEGLEITSNPVVFKTTASVSDIVRKLATHVTVAQLPLGFKAVLYQSYFNEQGIAYAFGNKIQPQSFLTTIIFKKNGTETEATFQVMSWKESAGLIVGQDKLKKLRNQVQAAFADLGNPVLISEDAKSGYCPKCGTQNSSSAKFCKSCGGQM